MPDGCIEATHFYRTNPVPLYPLAKGSIGASLSKLQGTLGTSLRCSPAHFILHRQWLRWCFSICQCNTLDSHAQVQEVPRGCTFHSALELLASPAPKAWWLHQPPSGVDAALARRGLHRPETKHTRLSTLKYVGFLLTQGNYRHPMTR